ncbi:MAG: hypothetical protein LBC75_12650 [Fibromonadaceae bacterium]|jgi:hypothetical protein|nr:hypothetical protein [Fibromonadaceae bacterium]
MKNIYFAVVLALLAFSACSNDPDDNSPSSSSKPDNSSSSNQDNSSSSNSDNSSSSNLDNSSSSKPDDDSNSGGCLTKRNGTNFQCLEKSEYFGEVLCTIIQGEWVDSCPPGGSICETESGGISTTSHFYDEENNPCSPLYSSSSIITNTPSSSSSSNVSSSSSNLGSRACYLALMIPNFGDMCAESETEPATPSDCEELVEVANSEVSGLYTGEIMDSCPSGFTLKCEIEADGEDEGGFMYFYGSMFTNATCESLL